MAEKYFNVANQETSEEINSKLGLANDTGGSESTETVMGKLNSLLVNGMVKGIQRGHVRNINGGVSTVTISAVIVEKSLVIVHGAGVAGVGSGLSSFYYGNLSSSTTVEVFGGESYDGGKNRTDVYWQVAEFY